MAHIINTHRQIRGPRVLDHARGDGVRRVRVVVVSNRRSASALAPERDARRVAAEGDDVGADPF